MDTSVNKTFKKNYMDKFAYWRAARSFKALEAPERMLITRFAVESLREVDLGELNSCFEKHYLPALFRGHEEISLSAVDELRSSTLSITSGMEEAEHEASAVSEVTNLVESSEGGDNERDIVHVASELSQLRVENNSFFAVPFSKIK